MKWDDLLNVLIELLKQSPEFKAEGVDETRIAAMIAALHSLAEKLVIEMKKGEFDQLYIKGSDGYLLVSKDAVLGVSTTRDVRLGLIFLHYKEIYKKIGKTISDLLFKKK